VDVGSHHGLVALRLLSTCRVESCVVTEVHEAGYQGPRGLPGLQLRFGNGLDALTETDVVDTVIVAGVGARTTLAILDHPRVLSDRPRLVLQPQTEWPAVRRWLLDHGFGLRREQLVVDAGHDYLILTAEHVAGAVKDYDSGPLERRDLLEAGPLLMSAPDENVARYWRDRRERARVTLQRATPGPGRRRAEREEELAGRVLAALARSP
jgi:tRNA (adenine22-N1)-methyltransferase